MRIVKTISKSTIKIILKIIYKIAKTFSIWFEVNFPREVEIDWDRLYDEWNESK